MVRSVSFLIGALVVGCQSEIKLPDEPNNLIPLSQMHSIIADVSVLESCIDGEYGQMSKYYKIVDASVAEYFKQAGIDTLRFRASLDYYHGHHTIGQKMYQDVSDTLALRFKKLKSSLPELELGDEIEGLD